MSLPDAALRPSSDGPSVSVILPVFNGGIYLREALESILGQTYRDFELNVIDDGSADQSLDILREFEAKDCRVRAVTRMNRGLVETLNELVDMSRGSLLARMDADDVAEPARLQTQVDFMRAHPEVVAVGTRALLIDREGCPIAEFVDHVSHAEIESALLRPEIGVLHPTAMIRLDAMRAVNGYRDDFKHVEDLDLFLRLAEHGKLFNISQPLLRYRVHPTSISHQNSREQAMSARRAVSAALTRRGIAPSSGVGEQANLSSPSVADLHRKWSWWALGAGNVSAARKHALKAVASQPLSAANLRLLACVARDSLRPTR